MRYIFLPAMLLAGLSTAAYAASSDQQAQGSSAANQQTANAQNEQSGGQDSKAMTQGKLRQSLTDAGFKDVTIVDAAYLVHATGPHGDDVMLLINPPTMPSSASSDGGSSDGGGQDQATANKSQGSSSN